jgi:enoyl-CoA hydratase/carnithine racemase
MRKPRAVAQGGVDVTIASGCVTATLTFRDPRGILDSATAPKLLELFEQVEDDDAARMLAITGSGSIFCRGFDPDCDPRLVESLAVISKPTVAIVNGYAIDEGLELALGADIRVALADARLGLTQIHRGKLPRFGGTQRLPRLVGAANALRMMLTSTVIDGREAARLGLVTYLAKDHSELARIAGDVAQAIISRAPLAARLVKDAVYKGYDMTIDQGIRLEEDLYALLQTTADRAEGVKAFLEKRKPLFRGA